MRVRVELLRGIDQTATAPSPVDPSLDEAYREQGGPRERALPEFRRKSRIPG